MRTWLFILGGLLTVGLGLWWWLRPIGLDPARLRESEALAVLTRSIEQGDAAAMVEMAVRRLEGRGVAKDPAAAFGLLQKAAAARNIEAHVWLGRIYERGLGVQPDPARAIEYYRPAASLARHREAQFALGRLYFLGKELEADPPAAVRWLSAAAGQGHAGAQHLLGVIHESGWAGARDLSEAYKWFALAAEKPGEAAAADSKYDPAGSLAALKAKVSRADLEDGERRLRAFKAGSPK